MFDIEFELLDDGSVRLEQEHAGPVAPNLILLHPEQLKFITRRACGMEAETAEQVEELERRISILAKLISSFVCDATIREEINDQCESGVEFMVRLDSLLNMAWEYDSKRLSPETVQ